MTQLPDLFLMQNGKRVVSLADWRQRREELKALLAQYEYGRMPPPCPVTAEDTSGGIPLFDGQAVQRKVTLRMGPEACLSMRVTLTLPAGRGAWPVIMRNYRSPGTGWIQSDILETVIRRGYMAAEYEVTDLQPDETAEPGPAKLAYPDYDWGTIAVWAWGGMRTLDYLLTLPEVDKSRIVVTGQSRSGKTALLTAALDERVAVAVPNCSGGGGFQCWRFPIWPDDPAGVNRHESVAVMSKLRTYWLHPGLKPYVDRVGDLPFDQHFLAALVAPRGLCAVETMDDTCGTPVCVQRTFEAAHVVYEWLDAREAVGMHFRRTGGHMQGVEDWAALLDFADRRLFGKVPASGRAFDTLPCPHARPAFSWRAPERRPSN